MKIAGKMSIAGILMGLLLLICGGAGYWGIKSLSDGMDYVTGPAWNTADGAMESTIHIESEMLLLDRIISNRLSPEEGRQALAQAAAAASEALERMLDSGLMAAREVNELKQDLATYRETRAALLENYIGYRRDYLRLTDGFHQFQDVMDRVEAHGDRQVEVLASNSQAMYSWDSGLQPRWEAADGGMEAEIALLKRYYYLQRLLRNEPDSAAQMDKALQMLEEKVTRLIQLDTFAAEITSGRFKGQTYAEVLQAQLTDHKAMFQQVTVAFKQLQQVQARYETASDRLLATVAGIEESGDSKVEGYTSILADTQQQAFFILGGSLLIGLLMLGIGYWLGVRLIVRPIIDIATRFQDIAQGEGDLTVAIQSRGNDEIAALAQGFNLFVEKIRRTIQGVHEATGELTGYISGMTDLSERASQGAGEQQQKTDLVATAMNEMVSSAQDVSSNAETASSMASRADQHAAEGKRVIMETVHRIRVLAEQVDGSATAIQ